MRDNASLPPRRPAGAAPLRVAGSVRRTSSIDVSWPDGQEGTPRLIGRARDVVTPPAGGRPAVCAEDSFQVVLGLDRTIMSIDAEPPRPALSRLVGERPGGGLRLVLEGLASEELLEGTPLQLILNDIATVSIIAGWAWSQWNPEWRAAARAALRNKVFGGREGICVGYAEGSSAFDPDTDRSDTFTEDLRNPDDPKGWHVFTAQLGVGFRRARRIDLYQDSVLVIDSAFQDSATALKGGRAVLHEYRMGATIDPKTLRLLTIEAEPRVLPFAECPGAVANLHRLIGTPLPELRQKIRAELRGQAGCTHLNDALRALAELPALVTHLTKAGPFAARRAGQDRPAWLS